MTSGKDPAQTPERLEDEVSSDMDVISGSPEKHPTRWERFVARCQAAPMANGQELQQLSIGLWTIKPISNTRWQIAQLEGSGDGWGVRMVPEAAELFWWAIESHWEHYGDRPLWGID